MEISSDSGQPDKSQNRYLPHGSQDGNVWRRVFVPTYFTFIAAYDDPWVVKDKDAIQALQKIWNHVYVGRQNSVDIPHTILVHKAVFKVVRLFLLTKLISITFSWRRRNVFVNGGEVSAPRP